MTEKTEQVENEINRKMDGTVENLKNELGSIHAGRVSPAIIDSIKVDYYGNPTPISQVSNISTPEPQMLVISPWEKSMMKEVERSLQAANMGFNISTDGNLIRAIMPPFTEDRRKEYVKQVKKISEENKIAIRNVRREGNDMLRNMEKEKEISQDNEKVSQANIQEATDKHINMIDNLVSGKEKELMSL